MGGILQFSVRHVAELIGTPVLLPLAFLSGSLA
jgi:hypothetical protein